MTICKCGLAENYHRDTDSLAYRPGRLNMCSGYQPRYDEATHELARLTAELSETQKRLAVAEKRIEKIHARMRQFQEYTVPNDVIVMWLDKWIAEELSQAKED